MAQTQLESTGSIPVRKVRVVAKIRGFSDPEANFASGTLKSVDWVSVNRENSGDFSISFGEQSLSRYSVDYFYTEHEDNEAIYAREVKPLVSAVFEGVNSTVIAHGARGSGKTHLIQGSSERPGLAALATSEFLSMAEENGKSIAVSFYEVDHQEHAIDLLNPEQSPILVLEDHGRIWFKGLTRTPVKSIAEFQNLYITACSSHNAAPKKGFERPRRSHLGFIVHVFSHNESVDSLVSKMNFVDMAGYEDARRKSSDCSGLAENKQINKSIYALLNVCHALSTNESRIPYRESKLTRMLQDSLRGASKVLLVSCLNPSFCQDTVYMVSLASRSCQWIHQAPLDSMNKSASLAKQTVILESTKESATSIRQKVTLNSTKKIASSAKQTVALDSTKKSASSAKQTVALYSTKENASSIRQKVTLNSIKKSASSIKQTVVIDSTKKSASSAKQTVALDSTMKSASSARHRVALDSTKKIASSAMQTVASDSIKKSASSAIKTTTSHKHNILKSASATTKKLPGSKSLIHEKKGIVAMNSSLKGRKLFVEASHSTAKVEKEISIAHVTKASEPLLDNSLSENGNDVQVNSRVEKEISIADVTNALETLLNNNSLLEDENHVELNSRFEKDNALADATNNVKLNMMKENDDSSLSGNEVELDPTVGKGISEDKEDYNEIHTPCAVNYSKDLPIADEVDNMNKENNNLMENGECSPPISSQLRELQSLVSSTPLSMELPEKRHISLDDLNMELPEKRHIALDDQISTEIAEPRTPEIERRDVMNAKSPWETFSLHGSGMKNSLVKDYLRILNTAEKDDLKKLKGIGEKRATYILELREESPEPFKSLDDLRDIGLSAKQIKGIMKKEIGELFN